MIDVRWWPDTDYSVTWQAMQRFTRQREPGTPDEIWLLQHPPVYTLGQAGRKEHLLLPGDIPVIHSDRGGQVTYHGPGQLMAYCLIDLRRRGLFIKQYVQLLEEAIIRLLDSLTLPASRLQGAPGVYVPVVCTQHSGLGAASARHATNPGAVLPVVGPTGGMDPSFADWAKIAALGIKISRGCAFHGLALNVNMDLTPFSAIDPCGYQGMVTTDLQSCGVSLSLQEAGDLLAEQLNLALQAYPHQSGAPA